MDSQVAQNRTAKSYDQGTKFDSKEASGDDHRRGVHGAHHGARPESQLRVVQRRGMSSMERLEGRWDF